MVGEVLVGVVLVVMVLVLVSGWVLDILFCRLVVVLVGVIRGNLCVLNCLFDGVVGVVIGILVMLLFGVGFLISMGRKIIVKVIRMMVLISCCFRGVFMEGR